jgi:hypothetical protein
VLACTPAEPQKTSVIHAFFLDQTTSTAADLPRARSLAKRELAEFRAGDALLLLAINDETSTAMPLVERETDPSDPDQGMSAQLAAVNAVEEARSAFEMELDRFATGRARHTDVFGMFDRVARLRAKSKRNVRVFAASDFLETKEVDLEKRSIRADELDTFVEKVVRDHDWRPDSLAGVEFRCFVTQAHGFDAKQRALEAVYRRLITALGGVVESWDTW